MKRLFTLIANVLGLGLLFPCILLAQTGDGYVGIYGDAAGTTPCVAVPPFTADTLFILIRTAGGTSTGITGAEFRIEATDTSGWIMFSFTPAPNATLVFGNPIDTDPDPNAGGGVVITFDACQVPDANGIIPLGTIALMNYNGQAIRLLVKRHSTPTNPTYLCPLLTLCDAPTYTKLCMTPSPSDTCLVGVNKLEIAAGDQPVFITTLNNEGVGDVPGAGDSLSNVARSLREAAISRGFREVDLGWRTPEEVTAWKQSRPRWMNKVSSMLLDRIRLLEEKNLLVQDRRHLAPEFSTRSVPIDTLARLKVECKVRDLAHLDTQYFLSIGGQLIETAPSDGYLTCWIPPEQIQTLAECADVVFIDTLPLVKGNSGSVYTEGDGVHRADALRALTGLKGRGQKVGVLALGANAINVSVGTGDLPSGLPPGPPQVQILGTGGTGIGAEGTAMPATTLAYQSTAVTPPAPRASPTETVIESPVMTFQLVIIPWSHEAENAQVPKRSVLG